MDEQKDRITIPNVTDEQTDRILLAITVLCIASNADTLQKCSTTFNAEYTHRSKISILLLACRWAGHT